MAKLVKEDGLGTQSASTMGRILNDLKKKGKLPNSVKYSLYAKTGKLIERKPRKQREKLRSKDWEGKLVKADTIVRFTNGVKRYILTAIDLESKFAFAYGYVSHKSASAADFMSVFKSVAPVSLEAVQTDNGSEFDFHFDAYLDKEGIIHFHSYPRSPEMNSEIERFNRTLSEAFISKHRYLLAYDLDVFNKALMDWLLWYNSRRPHWLIGLISPLRYICNKLLLEKSQMCWTSTAGVVKPKNAYLVFKNEISDEIIKQIIDQANENIKSGVEIKTYEYEDEKRKGFRWCAVKDYPPIPCGGLHVKNAKEIGEIVLVNKEAEKITIAIK